MYVPVYHHVASFPSEISHGRMALFGPPVPGSVDAPAGRKIPNITSWPP